MKCKRCNKLHMMNRDYCDWCAPYVRIEELEAKLERYEQVLQSIADEEETLGWVYAARMAKAVLLKGEQDND